MISATPRSPSAEEVLSLLNNRVDLRRKRIEELFQEILSLPYHDGSQNMLRFEEHTTGFYSVFNGVSYECFLDKEEAQEQYNENIHRAIDAISMSPAADDDAAWYYSIEGNTAPDRLEVLQSIPKLVEQYGVQFHTDIIQKCIFTLKYDRERFQAIMSYDEHVELDLVDAATILHSYCAALQRREKDIASWYGYEDMETLMKSPNLRAALTEHSFKTIQKVLQQHYGTVLALTDGNSNPKMFDHDIISVADWWYSVGISLSQARRFVMHQIFAHYETASKEFGAPLEWILPVISPVDEVLLSVYEYRAEYMQ